MRYVSLLRRPPSSSELARASESGVGVRALATFPNQRLWLFATPEGSEPGPSLDGVADLSELLILYRLAED